MSLPTSLWGMSFWKMLHFATLGYKIHPSDEEKIAMRNLIESLQYLLPCPDCRAHLRTNLKQLPLTDDILSVKLKLILWVHELHNRVNLLTKKTML